MRKPVFICFALICLAVSGFAQSVTLTSPNGGEIWYLDSTSSITWTYSGIPDTTFIKLVLFKDGIKIGNIVQNVSIRAGSCNWRVGDYEGGIATAGGGYRIRIRDMDGSYPLDESDASFTISGSQSFLRVDSPNGGEHFPWMTQQSIKWSSSGVNGQIKITLFRNGNPVHEICSACNVSSGSCVWLPGNVSGWNPRTHCGCDYKIRIQTPDGQVSDESDNLFCIDLPPGANIRVACPLVGDRWRIGIVGHICWFNDFLPDTQKIDIFLMKGGERLGAVVRGLPINNKDSEMPPGFLSYHWVVGSYEGGFAPAGDDYRIRIETSDGHSDESDGNFALTLPEGAFDFQLVEVVLRPHRTNGRVDAIEANALIRNNGDDYRGPLQVRGIALDALVGAKVSRDETILVPDFSLNHASQREVFLFNQVWPSEVRSITFGAHIDPRNLIPETNEGNNFKDKTYTPPPQPPGLVIGSD